MAQCSTLSPDNCSVMDNIISAITDAGEIIKSIKPQDIPHILKGVLDGLVNVGKELVKSIIDFFVKDVPGLLVDVCNIVFNYLPKKDWENILIRSKSALKHLTNVLEVLSLVPLFSVCTGILLACIYLAQKAWLLAACACLGFLKPIRLLVGKVLKGCASKLSKITNRCGALQRQVPGATANKSMKAMAQEATKTKTVTANSPKINTSSTTARQSMKATAKPSQATSSQKSVSAAKPVSQSPSVNTTKGSTVVADTASQQPFGKLLSTTGDGPTGAVVNYESKEAQELLEMTRNAHYYNELEKITPNYDENFFAGHGPKNTIDTKSVISETVDESRDALLSSEPFFYDEKDVFGFFDAKFEKNIDSIMSREMTQPVRTYIQPSNSIDVKTEIEKLYKKRGLNSEALKNGKIEFGI